MNGFHPAHLSGFSSSDLENDYLSESFSFRAMAVSPLLIGILTSLAVAVWFVVAAAVAKSVVYFAMAITDYRVFDRTKLAKSWVDWDRMQFVQQQVTNSAQVSASSLLHDNDVDDDVDVRQMSSDLRLVLYGSAQDHPPVHTTQSSAEKYVWVSEEPGSVTPAFALAPEWSGIFRTGISEHAGNSLPRSAALRA